MPANRRPAAPARAKRSNAAPPIEVHARPGQPLGMTPEAFLATYWQKHPVLIRQAFPGYTAPLTPEDLAGLACEEAALSRIVQYDRPRDAWTLRTGPFEESDFPGLPQRDWTLLVQDVDKWDPDVRALIPHFAWLPRWRMDDVMISFAAPGGSVGPHIDQYDVFLLQGLGQRHWQIDARQNPPTAFREGVELKLLQQFSASHDWVLEPGDMLYLPPGVPHHGEAVTACLTLSLGMRAPSHAELISDLADTLLLGLPDEQRYADPDLAPARDPYEIDAAALARVDAALAPLRDLQGPALAAWFGQFITRYRAAATPVAPARPLARDALAARLDAGDRLMRHPHARLAWSAAGRGAQLFACGDVLQTRRTTARMLAAAEQLEIDDWTALDDDARCLVHALYAQGVLVLQRAPRRRRPA